MHQDRCVVSLGRHAPGLPTVQEEPLLEHRIDGVTASLLPCLWVDFDERVTFKLASRRQPLPGLRVVLLPFLAGLFLATDAELNGHADSSVLELWPVVGPAWEVRNVSLRDELIRAVINRSLLCPSDLLKGMMMAAAPERLVARQELDAIQPETQAIGRRIGEHVLHDRP